MAKDKKSFVLYSDQRSIIDMLTDEQAGKLLKHIYSYVNDEDPELDDLSLKLAFEPIKLQLKRDLKKWEDTKDNRSNSGILGNLKRYNPDLYDKVKEEKISLEEAQSIAKDRKDSQSDTKLAVNDNVNVNVNDTVIDIDFKKLLDFINEKTERSFRTINKSVKAKFKARLKDGYTKEDIFNAIRNAVEVQYHIDNKNQYLTPEFFSRAETLDKYGGEHKNPYSINVGVTHD